MKCKKCGYEWQAYGTGLSCPSCTASAALTASEQQMLWEEARDAEKLKGGDHRKEGDERVYPERCAYYLRLYHLSHYRHHGVEYQQPRCRADVLDDKADYRPRDEHRSRTEYGQKIHECDRKRDKKRVGDLEYEQSHKHFTKGDEHYNEIRAQIFLERVGAERGYARAPLARGGGERA